MDARGSGSQYLGVRRQTLLGLVGIAAPVYLAVFAVGLISGRVGVPGLIFALIAPSVVVGGVVLLLKRPGHTIGELLVLAGMTSLVLPALIEAITVRVFEGSGAQGWMWVAVWLSQTLRNSGVVLATTLTMLLPDGRFRSQRERRLVAAGSIVIALPTLVALSNEFVVTSEFSFRALRGLRYPLFRQALEPYGPIFVSLNELAPAVFLGGIAVLLLRYRAAAAREQKQIRWVLLAGSAVGLLTLVPLILDTFGVSRSSEHGSLIGAVLSSSLVLVPASVVVAVLDPPWIDVDIVIRKSVVYGALSGIILLLYIAVATSVGVAAGAQLGLSIELAVVLTVVIAILFQPARVRLQALADRWVFGARPTNYEAVTAFGATVEQAAEPTQLLPPLVETVRRATRLTWVSVSLDDGSIATSGSVSGEPVLRLPIGVGEEHVGEIVCGPKVQGRLGDDDILLVRTLAGQLALAVRNARLAGRVVNAAESERRRIERNIHDGAQQELVALVAKLGMARSAAAKGRLSAGAIDDLRLDARQILSDLRELSQGIHPSVLSDGGILEAVEDRCARLPIAVTIESSEGVRALRFDDNIEGAAYFFVTESLANVLKHADATRATISVACEGDRLELGVVDDGRGFDPAWARDGGLAGLRDRILALGGTFVVASRPGRGTRITASLPVSRP
jgi:signal transduction histidine kinase